MSSFAKALKSFLNSPFKVLFFCMVFALLSLLLNGNFIRLYKLDRDTQLLSTQIEQVQVSIARLDSQLTQAKDPAFIERQALNLYDFAEEDDLVFVFSE